MENKESAPLLALVGMPGSGKSETAQYLSAKGFNLVRFGELTDEGLRQKNLPITPENEENFRQELRKTHGMEAYAVLAAPKIEDFLEQGKTVVIDGLYSWEEYKFLKNQFPKLILMHVYAEPTLRHSRLNSRSERPFTKTEAERRDFSEIENLNKGGPIAIADYLVENNSDLDSLKREIDNSLERMNL